MQENFFQFLYACNVQEGKNMNISPVRLNFNVLQQKRQNVAQKDKLPQLASDSISFSAKIPENIKAEIKYGKLVDKEGEGIKNAFTSVYNRIASRNEYSVKNLTKRPVTELESMLRAELTA